MTIQEAYKRLNLAKGLGQERVDVKLKELTSDLERKIAATSNEKLRQIFETNLVEVQEAYEFIREHLSKADELAANVDSPQFLTKIKQKDDHELFNIVISQDGYQEQFLKEVMYEFFETRGLTILELIQSKTDNELREYLIQSPKFKPEFIQLVQTELTDNRNVPISSILEEKKEFVHREMKKSNGWLTFFLIVLGLGGLRSLLEMFTLNIIDYSSNFGEWHALFGLISDVILMSGFSFIAFYTIWSFRRNKPNAVPLAKVFLSVALISNIVALIINYPTIQNTNGIYYFLIPIAVQLSWYAYFSYSSKIKALFPIEERKLYQLDKWIAYGFWVPSALWLLSLFFVPSYPEQENIDNTFYPIFFNEEDVAEWEYTDGRVVFSAPEGILFEKIKENDDVYFAKSSEIDGLWLVISSWISDDFSNHFFQELHKEFKLDDYADLNFSVIKDKTYTSYGKLVQLKVIEYHTEQPFFWTFVMISHENSHKSAIINCYSYEPISFLDELINSFRFE